MRFPNCRGKVSPPSMVGASGPTASNSAHDDDDHDDHDVPVPTTGRGDDGGIFASRFLLGGLGRGRRDARREGGEAGGGGGDAVESESASSYAAMADSDGGERRQREGTVDGTSNDGNARHDVYYEISSENENEAEEEGGGEWDMEYVAPDEAVMEDATKGCEQRQKRTRAAAKSIKRAVSMVLPKVEILPWTTFLSLSLWCTIP